MYATEEAISRLKEIVHEGDTIYTILRHVSQSGMKRWISFCIIGEDRKPRNIDGLVADAGIGQSVSKQDAYVEYPP